MNTQNIRCIIVDDEPLAIKVIASHLNKVSDIEIVATCTDAIAAYEIIQKQQIDLVFLDIQMPELTGIELVKTLEFPPKVIFTTAFRDYALEGFELDVVDYLLKPVSLPRLLRALDKYRRLLPRPAASPAETHRQFLTVRSNRQTRRIPLEEILFIESLSDYVQIHTTAANIITKEKISSLSEKLASDEFLRIHRSFLVSIKSITSFTADTVQVNQHTLPVSRSYRKSVKDRMALR